MSSSLRPTSRRPFPGLKTSEATETGEVNSAMKTSFHVPWFFIVLLGALGVGYYGSDLIQVGPVAFLKAGAGPQPPALVGRASVIDGDTIEIHGERIRFNGIDAPESLQTCSDKNGKPYQCGARAAEALASFMTDSSPTRCEFVERDQYGRFVGNCFRADGASVGKRFSRFEQAHNAADLPRHRFDYAATGNKAQRWTSEGDSDIDVRRPDGVAIMQRSSKRIAI